MSLDHLHKKVPLYIFAALLAGGISMAAETARAAEEGGAVYTGQAGASAPGGEAMIARARAKGSIRVIVGLAMTMRPEKGLAAADAAAQRQALAERQGRVAARALGASGAAAVRFETIPYLSAFVDADQLGRLLADPEVVSVQEDVPVPPLLGDSVPLIHATDLFAKDIEGIGHVVAVLDTGAASRHPMLKGKVESEACYSTNHAPSNATSVCPGGVEKATGEGTAKNCPLSTAGCDHGTHVASIAAGNSERLDGVARGADVIAVQVFSQFSDCGPCAKSFTTDQIKGLERVLKLSDDFNIDAVNMSLGGGSFTAACDAGNAALKTAIDNLRNAGIATLIASGNDGFNGSISSPACISSAIAVGNTTKKDLIAESSNHSPLVKLMAPGSDIEAAVPPRAYADKTGTSMATPHVAGAFALLRDAKPTASVDTILTALTCSGKTVNRRDDAFGGFDIEPQRPRIDLLGAYSWLRAPPANKRDWLFENAKEALDWTQFRGTWRIRNGSYSPAPIIPGWVGAYAANCSGSFRAEAVMTRTDPGTEFHSNAGIMFKTTINQSTKTISGYFVAYNHCRMSEASVCTNDPELKPGQAVFFKMNNVDLDGTTGFAERKCTVKAKVNPNKANVVKVVSNGSSHTFFLNGRQVCQVDDATYISGPTMLVTFVPGGEPGHAFKVDQLLTQSTDLPPAGAQLVMDPASYAEAPALAGVSLTGTAAQ